MNKIRLLILMIYAISTIYAQTASDYFPAQTGYKWYFESVPLDSLNNPVNSQKFYSIDSFAVVAPFSGKNANIVLTKTGALNTINFQPYLDSLFYNFETTNGFEYFDPVNVAGLLGNIDTTLGIIFFNFFNSLEGWYSYYRFASNLNQSYQVYKKDTTVTFDSTSLPIRFELLGKRLSDEILNTAIGTFTCKKFLLERRLSYLISIPPFPTIAIKILGVEESIWLAPDNWRVKSYIPSTNVDFSILGIPVFNVPGLATDITPPIVVPVELVSFIVQQVDHFVKLNWTTATEINNRGFEIERLKDVKINRLQDWELIGFVVGHSTTTEPKSYSFIDNEVCTGTFKYRLKQIDFDGSFKYSDEIGVEVDFTPKEFMLYQNYPNPFNPDTKIRYSIPNVISTEGRNLKVVIKVYDVLGNKVATLVDEDQPAGNYEVEFDATKLSSGVYYYQIKSGELVQTRKMVLLK